MRTLLLGGIVLTSCALWSFAAEPGKAPDPEKAAAAEKTAAPAADAAPLLSEHDSADVDAIAAAMLAAGFPDAKNATLYRGILAIRATFDPSKGAPLPSDGSKTQMTVPNSNLMTYSYEFDGLHFKLADGSWIVSLAFHFHPNPGDEVSAKDALELKVPSLTADAIKAYPFDSGDDADKWLAKIVPEQRELSKRAMKRLVPLTYYLKLTPDNMAPATVLLQRAGWKDAADLSLAIANQRARSFWQLHPWTNAESVFDPTGAYQSAYEEEEAWEKKHERFTSEPPSVALRRALFRWCRAQLGVADPEDALLPRKVAAAAAKAAVDPNDPQENGPRIDAMLLGADLPIEPATGADLATRLQSWEAHRRTPKMTVSGGGNGTSISTTISAPKMAYRPDKKDLDGLVDLLADERPSRYMDFTGPRTLGDNAWRAVTILLKADPRTLAGYPTDHIWSSGERRAAATAVQTWWKEHRKEYVAK